jgi:hypothetical protein
VTPRRLGFAEAATLQRRARYLVSVRDEAFGNRFAVEIKAWLDT